MRIVVLILVLLMGCFGAEKVQALEKVIQIPNDMNDWEILGATPGKSVAECGQSSAANPGWQIAQWKNENSLCKGGSGPVAECPGADMVKATNTARFCYWKNERKVQTALNTQSMSYSGCWAHRTAEDLNNPGGYSVYASLDLGKNYTDWWSSPFYSVGKLKSLQLSSYYSTDYYASSVCPGGVSDPIAGRDPVAFAYLNIIAVQIDPVTKQGKNSIFYQNVLFDNRRDWQTGSTDYFNCSLSNSSSPGVVIIGDPIQKYGMPMSMPGEAERYYQWNILENFKAGIARCLGSNVNFDDIRVSGVFMGNEMHNTTVMTNTFRDPRVVLTLKDGVELPTSTPAPPTPVVETCPKKTIGDADCDGVVGLADFAAWKQEFLKKVATKNADFSKNGSVGLEDFGIWKKGYLGLVTIDESVGDGIVWGGWSDYSISGLFPAESLPVDTRVIIKAPNKWYDDVIKGRKYWDRTGVDVNNLTMVNAAGLDVGNAFPIDWPYPLDSRVMYTTFDGNYDDAVTSGNVGYYRTVKSDWSGNVRGWSKVADLQAATGLPAGTFPLDTRFAYNVDNRIIVDAFVKGNVMWVRTQTNGGVMGGFKQVSLKSYGLTDEMLGMDSIVVYKNPSTGKWEQTITKGSQGWKRVSN